MTLRTPQPRVSAAQDEPRRVAEGRRLESRGRVAVRAGAKAPVLCAMAARAVRRCAREPALGVALGAFELAMLTTQREEGVMVEPRLRCPAAAGIVTTRALGQAAVLPAVT